MPDQRTALSDFLMSAFSSDSSLIQGFFWKQPYYEEMKKSVRFDQAVGAVARDAVDWLKSKGHIKAPLFDALLEECPGRPVEIAQLRALWLTAAVPRIEPAQPTSPTAPTAAATNDHNKDEIQSMIEVNNPLISDLLTRLGQREVIFVGGAGVSFGASGENPVALWSGLLKNGIEYLKQLGLVKDWWVTNQLMALKEGDLNDWLDVAGQITTKLGGEHDGRFARWLGGSVGKLPLVDPETIAALHVFDCLIATTNYDGLMSQVTNLAPITWQQAYKVDEWVRGHRKGIHHLHGYYDEPASVILSARSYWSITGDERAQAVQSALLHNKTLVFVGCGAGLRDPNIGALLAWAKEHLKGAGARHYRLCHDGELAALRAEHSDSPIVPISYGADHPDLAPWLREMRRLSSTPSAPKEED